MSDTEIPLGPAEIRGYLGEVAEELEPDGAWHVIVVVGGSLLALHGLRGATRDVDSVKELDQEVVTAVATVAARHDLAPKWLNDSAARFIPADFDESSCEVLLDRPHLLVLGAPPEQVFLMKLFAGRAVDREDLVKLWPLCQFDSPEDAVAQVEAAYPHREPDPYLSEYVARIASEADPDGPRSDDPRTGRDA